MVVNVISQMTTLRTIKKIWLSWGNIYSCILPCIHSFIQHSLKKKSIYWMSALFSHSCRYRDKQNICLTRANVNKIPQTGWLEQQKLVFSPFWKLKIWDQGFLGLVPSERCEQESVLCLSPRFWWFAGNLSHALVHGKAWPQSLPSSSHGISPVPVFVSTFPLL